jgi:hypothetical protein
VKRAWKWLAAAGGALVAVLAAVWGVVAMRGEEERRQRELRRTVEKAEKASADAQADLARKVAKGDAELAAAADRDREQVAEALEGGLADHLRKRNRAGGVRPKE